MDLVIPDQVAVASTRRGGSVDQAAALLVPGGVSQGVPRARCGSTCRFCELREDETALVYEHVRRFFREVETKKYKVHVRVFMSRYRGYTVCPGLRRIAPAAEALYIRVGGKNAGRGGQA